MAILLSSALLRFAWNYGSIAQALAGGVMEIYTGTQPTGPETAPTGTLLVTITDNGGAWTAETPASGSVEIGGTGSGSCTSLTVDGVELLTATVTGTSKGDLAYNLYAHLLQSPHRHAFFLAYDGDWTVTLTCKPGFGTRFNSAVVDATVTTLTATETNFSGGVASANGLTWGEGSNYSQLAFMSAPTTQTKKGTAVAAGEAGWFRIKGAWTDAGADDTGYEFFRLDGSISETGGGGNMIIDDATISVSEEVTLGTITIKSPDGIIV